MVEAKELLRGDNLVVQFRQTQGFRRHLIYPVNQISLAVASNEIVGIVGESGSGKTTLGRALAGMTSIVQGSLWLKGRNVSRLNRKELRKYWEQVQMIFQDVYNSLNPIYTVEQQLSVPIQRHASPTQSVQRELENLLQLTGLTPTAAVRARLPHELSGGQRQRVAIVRALAAQPDLLIADEPVSMLDVSLRAEILQLLGRLRDNLGLAIVYITHDLPSAVYIADRILVMYGGCLVETIRADALIQESRHPYTERLLAAARFEKPASPPGSGSESATSSVLLASYKGCPYAPRCPIASQICSTTRPSLVQIGHNHLAACHALSASSEAQGR